VVNVRSNIVVEPEQGSVAPSVLGPIVRPAAALKRGSGAAYSRPIRTEGNAWRTAYEKEGADQPVWPHLGISHAELDHLIILRLPIRFHIIDALAVGASRRRPLRRADTEAAV
jgi:hypothetical protein